MIEYRTASNGVEGDGSTLHGLVTPFNTWTTIGDLKRGGFKERIASGAFTKTLQERDIVLIHNHDTAMPMARTSIADGPGSLTLTPDPSVGLRAFAKPVDTSYSRDVLKCAKAGVIRGMSIGFEAVKDEWTDDAGNPSDATRGTQRTLNEIRLHEVTTTAFPAYTSTQLSARDAINAARERRAAKASYADVETCGECGATSQYGAYCGQCGGSMDHSSQSGSYCTSCGSQLDDAERSAHVCETRKTAPKPYGDVEYADPKNGKYPVDTVEHAKAAWAYISVPKNAAEYPMNGVSLSSVKAAIVAALTKFGVKVDEQNGERLALEWRDFTNPHGVDMAADGQGCSCLAAADASLDSAKEKLTGIDRNTLPPEVNQAIDLMTGAAHLISEHNKNAGTPDPDKPNGNAYQSPAGDNAGAGADHSDEDERNAAQDLAIRMAISSFKE